MGRWMVTLLPNWERSTVRFASSGVVVLDGAVNLDAPDQRVVLADPELDGHERRSLFSLPRKLASFAAVIFPRSR